MSRVTWLQERKNSIGGSDAAGVLGFSRYTTHYRVYMDKTSSPLADADNEAMKWGRILEPVIRQEYASVTGSIVLKPKEEIIFHPTMSYLSASLDGFTADGRIVEIKTAKRSDEWGDEGSDEIPVEYFLQVQHYMLVTGFTVADVAVLFNGSKFSIYTVDADTELQGLMLKGYALFWDAVQTLTPPEPLTEMDMLHYFRDKNTTLMASDELAQKVATLRDLRETRKEIEHLEQSLRLEIMRFMGENSTLVDTDENPIITWKESKKLLQRRFLVK